MPEKIKQVKHTKRIKEKIMHKNHAASTILAVILYIGAAWFALLAVVLPLNQLTQNQASVNVNLVEKTSQKLLSLVTTSSETMLQTGNADGLNAALASDGAVHVPLYLRLLTDLGTSVWALGLALAAFLLAKIITNISQADPFNKKHAKYLTYIGVAVLLSSIVADSINFLAAKLFTEYYQVPANWSVTLAGFGVSSNHNPEAQIQILAEYSYVFLAIAAVVFILAGAFKTGRTLQEDLEGLV